MEDVKVVIGLTFSMNTVQSQLPGLKKRIEKYYSIVISL